MLPLDYHISKSKLEQKNFMIFLHGYGANAQDFINMVPYFDKLPHTSFISVNAPFICPHHMDGYQWFAMDYVNNHYKITKVSSVYKASLLLSNFRDYLINKYHIETKNMAWFGFSQGAILSLCHGLYTRKNYGAIIAHSGAFYEPPLFNIANLRNKSQNILLLHGEQDHVVPMMHFNKTKDFFTHNHIPYDFYVDKNLEHSLSENTIDQAQNFILNKMYNV